uniref:Uncharacterized protein n=1 Tax=Oryza meridionalis TaxID=40149 RepID=A0A0E0C782_9ORYZ
MMFTASLSKPNSAMKFFQMLDGLGAWQDRSRMLTRNSFGCYFHHPSTLEEEQIHQDTTIKSGHPGHGNFAVLTRGGLRFM